MEGEEGRRREKEGGGKLEKEGQRREGEKGGRSNKVSNTVMKTHQHTQFLYQKGSRKPP